MNLKSITRKEMALAFLHGAASGNIQNVFEKYVATNFRHHNAFFKGDASSLMMAMAENAATNPGKILEIQRALEDGDLVAVHSRVRQKAGERGAAVVHIFRFEGNQIAELWDFGQPVPEDSPNEYGMF